MRRHLALFFVSFLEQRGQKCIRVGKANYAREGGIWDSRADGNRKRRDQEASSALQRGGEGANCRAVLGERIDAGGFAVARE